MISAEGPRGLRGGRWPGLGRSLRRDLLCRSQGRAWPARLVPFPTLAEGKFPKQPWHFAVPHLPARCRGVTMDAENVRLSGTLLARAKTQNVLTHTQVATSSHRRSGPGCSSGLSLPAWFSCSLLRDDFTRTGTERSWGEPPQPLPESFRIRKVSAIKSKHIWYKIHLLHLSHQGERMF